MQYPITSATVEILPNGLTVILDPDATVPVVSAQAWVETGSIHEDRLLGAGLSHFLEHMVFKGTRDYGSEELAQTVQGAGGHWNAYTTFGRTVYYIDGPAKSLPEFLKCLTGLVYHPTLPEDEFEREKDVIRREIDMGLDDPDDRIMKMMLSTVFQQDPRRYPVIGHRHLFDAISYEDLISYHRQRYTTDRSFLAISGDFDSDKVRKQLEELTGDCHARGGVEPMVASDPAQLGPRFARDRFEIPVSRLSLCWRSPALNDPISPAFEILAAVLGRGRSSRFYQALREQQALAHEISAFQWSFHGMDGLFGVSAECQPERVEDLIKGIKDVVRSINTDQLVFDIEKACRQIASSQFRTLMTASGRATDLASNWHESRDLNFTRHYLQSLERVRPEQLEYAASQLNERGLNLTILDPVNTPIPKRSQTKRSKRADIECHTLGNGLKVALIADHRIPMVQFQLAARAGLPSESLTNQGINCLLAATLPKGTETRSGEQIARDLESLGASIGAAAGNNALLLHASGLSTDCVTVAKVMAEIAIAPSLDEMTLEREKASQLASLQESQQDPLQLVMQTLKHKAYQSVGYGLNAMGSKDSLKSLHRPKLLQHQRKHLVGKNLSLAVCGDFESEAMLEDLEKYFGIMHPGKSWKPPAHNFQPAQEITRRLPKKQAVLAIGYEGCDVSAEDRHALAFLQEYASDMAGPLFGRIREELGLAYQVGATQFMGYDTGLFSFYLATSPQLAELAREEMLKEIAKIADAGIPTDAFERVRATALSGLALQQQSLAATARVTALDLLFNHSADTHRQLDEVYSDLKPEEVAKTAQRIFAVEPVIVEVLPEC